MSALPQELPWEDADNKWSAILNPIIANPANNSSILKNIQLINGTTIVNHKLGRVLQGWIIIGINGVATIYDNQASNQMPQLTLSLTSNAAVTANILVF